MENNIKEPSDQSVIGSEMPEHPSPHIIRYGIGLDVHKDIAAVCVRAQLETSLLVDVRTHIFRTTPQGIRELVAFLRHFHPVAHFLMECTGVYHLPIYYALQRAFPEENARIVAMNPLMVRRRIADFGNKTDKVDAQNLATLAFYDGLIRPSYIGTASFFQLRDLMRSYHKSQNHLNRLANRLHRTLHVANQKYPFNFGLEWNLQLLDRYITNGKSLFETYTELLQERKDNEESTGVLEKQAGSIAPYGEIILTPEQRFLLQMNLSRFLQEQLVASVFLQQAESKILADPEFADIYQRLRLIPGLGSVTTLTLLVELGDFRRFWGIEAFLKFCGIVPQIAQSANVRAPGRINRSTNRYIRCSLIQAAGVIVNSAKTDTDLTQYAYKQRVGRGKSYKLASVKVAQKMARIIYHVLIDGITYNPTYEGQEKKRIIMQRRLNRQQSLLESSHIKVLKRDISNFLVTHHDHLNSQARFHLVAGFHRIIRKANWEEKTAKKRE